MTVHIGSFGTARPKVNAKFEYFGTDIRVHPDASDLAYTEFLAIARDIEVDDNGQPKNGVDNQRAATLLDDTLRGQIHPEDLETFMALARANRQTVMDLMVLSQQIVSAVSGFPTGQPSDSSAGPDGGQQKSPDGSLPRAERRKQNKKQEKANRKAAKLAQTADLVSVAAQGVTARTPAIADPAVARATRALNGRPDLQLMVMRRQETLEDSA